MQRSAQLRCIVSNSVVYADDGCFYDINAQKAIDLSMYSIDLWETGSIYFVYGECTFVTKNDLGTKFEITIDTSGQVLSEIKQ